MDNNLMNEFQKAEVFFTVAINGEKEMLNISDEAFAYLSSLNIDWTNPEEIDALDPTDYVVSLFALRKRGDAWRNICEYANIPGKLDINKVFSSQFYSDESVEDIDYFEALEKFYNNGQICDKDYMAYQLMRKSKDGYNDQSIIDYLSLETDALHAEDILDKLVEILPTDKRDMFILPEIVENYLIHRASYGSDGIDKYFTFTEGVTSIFAPTKELVFKFMEENVIHSAFNTMYYVVFDSCKDADEVSEACDKIIDFISTSNIDDSVVDEYYDKLKNNEITMDEFNSSLWEKYKTFKNVRYLSDEISIMFIDRLIERGNPEDVIDFVLNNGIMVTNPYIVNKILLARDINIAQYNYIEHLSMENIEYIAEYKNLPMMISDSEDDFDAYRTSKYTLIVHNDDNPTIMFASMCISIADINPDNELLGWIYDDNLTFDQIPLFNFESDIEYQNFKAMIFTIIQIYTDNDNTEDDEDNE